MLCEQDGAGQWLSMDSEIIMKNGEPIGTQGPTGHYVLLDAHFELPSGMSSLSIYIVNSKSSPRTTFVDISANPADERTGKTVRFLENVYYT